MRDVVNVLSSIKGSGYPIYFLPNGGNAGDALINMGFYCLAKRLKLRFQEIQVAQIPYLERKGTVILAPGGALVPEWKSTSNHLEEIAKRRIRVIILPASVRDQPSILEQLTVDSIVFCRERYSFSYCREILGDEQVVLDHDMAFHANVEQILSSKFSLPPLTWKNIIRMGIASLHVFRSIFTDRLNALRSDKEMREDLDLERYLINDLSLVASLGTDNYEQSLRSAKLFLNLINLYRTINTDRLHVGIAACLLGKRVTFFPNSYFKIQGVYELSIRNQFNAALRVC